MSWLYICVVIFFFVIIRNTCLLTALLERCQFCMRQDTSSVAAVASTRTVRLPDYLRIADMAEECSQLIL